MKSAKILITWDIMNNVLTVSYVLHFHTYSFSVYNSILYNDVIMVCVMTRVESNFRREPWWAWNTLSNDWMLIIIISLHMILYQRPYLLFIGLGCHLNNIMYEILWESHIFESIFFYCWQVISLPQLFTVGSGVHPLEETFSWLQWGGVFWFV